MKEAVTNELNNAFLDLEINKYIPSFRNEHKEEYSIIVAIIDLFKILKNKLVGKTIQRKDLFLISSIVELDRLFQSAVILSERGLPEAANIIIRTILELSFNIVDALYNENHSKRILEKENNKINGTINIIKNYKMLDFLDCQEIDETKESNQKTIYKKDYLDFVKTLAEKYGLKKEYLLYRSYCADTHMSPSVLLKNYEIGSSGVQFDSGVKLNDFKNNMSILIGIVMKPIQYFIEIYVDDDKIDNLYWEICDRYVTVFGDVK